MKLIVLVPEDESSMIGVLKKMTKLRLHPT